MTFPSPTVVLLWPVIVPVASDAEPMVDMAALSAIPTTPGTDVGSPDENTILTGVPSGTQVPAKGFCQITQPAETAVLLRVLVTPVTRFAWARAVFACEDVMFDRSGTTVVGPLTTVIKTVWGALASVPLLTISWNT
jgi:hypothetical protein